MIRRGQIYNLFSKFHVRHEGFEFYDPRNSDEEADTDLLYIIFAGLNAMLN